MIPSVVPSLRCEDASLDAASKSACKEDDGVRIKTPMEA